MQEQLQRIEQRLEDIEERNKRVEADKAWETSIARTVSIVILTYVIAVIVMYVIDVERVLLNALIPTVGFFLSTLTLPFLKKRWIRSRIQDASLKR